MFFFDKQLCQLIDQLLDQRHWRSHNSRGLSRKYGINQHHNVTGADFRSTD